jgi:hypothetical protein
MTRLREEVGHFAHVEARLSLGAAVEQLLAPAVELARQPRDEGDRLRSQDFGKLAVGAAGNFNTITMSGHAYLHMRIRR